MNIYAESSAVLAWLFGEPTGEAVRMVLAKAELIIASDLTLVECERVLIRAQIIGGATEAHVADRRATLYRAAVHWHMLRLQKEVLDRASRPFPNEPIRTLDALHLSSALLARSVVSGLAILRIDERIRANAHRLGFDFVPD